MDAVHGIDLSGAIVIAFLDNLGTVEMMIVAIAALLLFGKRLPEVASQAGATIAKFRRSLDGAIQDSGVEQELRKIKSSLPSNMSMSDMARIAARRFEERARDAIDLEDVGKAAAAGASVDALPNPDETKIPAQKSSDATQSAIPGADAHAPTSSASPWPADANAPASSEASSAGSAPSAPSSITPSSSAASKPGIDPASRFIPPGSVPRE